MSLRIRKDGRVLCAVMHGPEPGDVYLDDGQHYHLSAELGVLATEVLVADPQRPGRGGHETHGEWWWRGLEPADAVLETRTRREFDASRWARLMRPERTRQGWAMAHKAERDRTATTQEAKR